ncbi:MAG: serine/threonine-protein kinase [Gemmatimonadaceae bacterium]
MPQYLGAPSLTENRPTRFQPGDLVADRYRIEHELGQGGMAVVYLAHDAKHETRVALKVLSDDYSTVVGAQRFVQEIKLTAGLQHPHILPAYDSGVTAEGTLFYVMPYVEGGSLRRRMEVDGPLPVADVIRITREISHGLAFAHERGIVHRDIKPENVLFLGGHALLADFGIARLLASETADRLTVQGSVLGTPAYMSPEQGLAMPVDARSDIYSLACVVYEMLTGKLPFSGPNAGVWMEHRLSRMPASPRSHRAELPASLDDVLIRALAPSPGDRHQTVTEFVDALDGTAPVARKPPLDARRAWRSGLVAGAAIAIVALVGTASVKTPAVRDGLIALGMIKLDSTRLFIAPFQSDTTTAAIATASEGALRDELSRWIGIAPVTAAATADAIGDRRPLTLDGALSAARRVRAGLVVWARAVPAADGAWLEVQLFDGRTGAHRTDVAVQLPRGEPPRDADIQTVAAALLASTDAPLGPPVLRAAGSTRSIRAWRAYIHGHGALDEWRLPAAESAFTVAAATDPAFPQSRVWSAQTMVWNRRGARLEWFRLIEEAMMVGSKLDTADLLVARAVGALGRGNDPLACATYSAVVARDSLNAMGWMGLGDCQAIDSVVTPDARSPSGYAFRGNLSRAMSAYERAVRLAPGAHAALPLAFVERVLLTRSDRYRAGFGTQGATFSARPSAAGDTVEFVPRPIIANTMAPDPPGFEEGLRRNQARLLDYVNAWVQRAPASAEAFEALATVQESRAELSGGAVPGGGLSAMAALDSARRLDTDAEARARIGAAEVRLLLKAGEFDRARARGDSLLDPSGNVTAREAHWLAGIAALTGRDRDAARLARLGQAPPVMNWDTLPPALADEATMLLLRAAHGACGEALAGSFRRMDGLIESYTPPAHRLAARDQLLRRARLLSAPCSDGAAGEGPGNPNPWERAIQRLARGDSSGVRAGFDSLLVPRRYRRPGGIALDYTFMEAWLLVAIGDTTAAVRHLDQTLNALPTMTRNAVWELSQAATVGRAMAWRAELAFRLGDVETGRRWGAALLDLWHSADAELNPVLARVRTLLAASGT